MDLHQLASMIEWLDEERRRDKANLVRMEERLGGQQDTIDTLTRRLAGVESENGVLRAQLQPNTLATEADIMDKVRRELRTHIESVEAKRLVAEREVERRGDVARESLARALREVTDRVGKMERTSSDVPGLQLERERLSEAIASLQIRLDDLTKRLEEPSRRIVQLEEQRRADTRRMSETESEMPDLVRAVEGLRTKVQLIEDLAIRNERRINEIQTSDRDRRDQIQQFIDQQTLLGQQRDHHMNEIAARFTEHDATMDTYVARFEAWSETHRTMRRVVEDFERISERLERRINEVAEIQRHAENRFREEWNEYRSEEQRRLRQFTLSNDDVWRNHDKEFERFVARLHEMEGMFPPLTDSLARLWQLERTRADLYRERYTALLHEFDTGTPTPPPAPANGSNGPYD